MGGHEMGEIASRMAVEMVADGVTQSLPKLRSRRKLSEVRALAEEIVREWTQEANAAIHRKGQREAKRRGLPERDPENPVNKSQMGTTLALALFLSDFAVVANVGDSRVYRIRSWAIEQITDDHTIVAEAKRHPADPRPPRKRKYVTRALGTKPKVRPDVHLVHAFPGDLFLLCSDGLTDVVTDDEIVEILRKARGDYRKAIRSLIHLANKRGGPDNVTIVVAEVEGGEDEDDDTDELEIWQQ
jgi:protein phosphatase